MNTNEHLKMLSSDVSKLISEFNKHKKTSGESQQSYHAATEIVDVRLKMLCAFAERYLGLRINVDYTCGNQYDPGTINGFNIEEVSA